MMRINCKTEEVVEILQDLGYAEDSAWRLAMPFNWDRPAVLTAVRMPLPVRAFTEDGRQFVRC